MTWVTNRKEGYPLNKTGSFGLNSHLLRLLLANFASSSEE
jgi:hypothetical protein